jgi:hypothetical protein
MLDYIVAMNTGRINSEESLAMGEAMFEASGHSWRNIEQVAHRTSDGVYIVRRSELAAVRRDERATGRED